MNKTVIGTLALVFMVLGIGCATTTQGSRYTDAEVEMAQRQAESETLARLASSSNDDVADSASTIARERTTR